MTEPSPQPAHPPLAVVADEVARTLGRVDPAALDALVGALRVPGRTWFCTGAGRSGLVAQMAAMRLVHLGLTAHVVGGATTPSLAAGDALLVLSASGTTALSRHVAEAARAASAVVVVVTATPGSPLGQLADTVVEVPARGSGQFGGSLFEQTSLLVLDAAALALGPDDPAVREAMHGRHANLE